MENDPRLEAFLKAYQHCKDTPDGDADELSNRCGNLRDQFEELVENLG